MTAAARTRIAVVTADVLQPQMAGPAIRAWEIASALSADPGIDADVELVTTATCRLSSPSFAVCELGDGLEALLAGCDVLLVQGSALDPQRLRAHPGPVVVVDLYDPFHLEQLEQRRDLSPELRRRTLANAVAEANQLCLRGDFLVCASDKQRDLWLGHLAALGRLNPATYDADPTLRALLDVVPFGVPADAPRRTQPRLKGVVDGIGPDDRVVLWGGGIYNWFDPLTLIRAVELLSRRRDDVRLFFLGMQHPHPDVPEMRMSLAARALSDELALTGRAVFFNETWVRYDERADYLLEADVGVSTHLDHVETDFSFRTRMLDYLWAGLPMVCTRGDVFAGLVDAHGLGRTVAPGDVEGLAAALDELLDDEAAASCRAAVRALAPQFAWPRVLAPLLAFCAAPRRAPDLADPDARRRLERGAGRLYAPRGPVRRELGIVVEHLQDGGVRRLVGKAADRLARRAGRAVPPR